MTHPAERNTQPLQRPETGRRRKRLTLLASTQDLQERRAEVPSLVESGSDSLDSGSDFLFGSESVPTSSISVRG